MRILLLTVIMIFTSSANAGLYKWVDEEGNIHYSQKRPRDKQFKKIKPPAEAPENAQPLYKSTKLKSNTGNVLATETAKNNKIRATNCTNAKKNLNSYQLTRRVRDKDGNVTIVDDNERARQIEVAKNAISEFCK